ncbi:MAG: hypothetical protein ACRDTQ_13285 [Micromonosporaceae bacterium]
MTTSELATDHEPRADIQASRLRRHLRKLPDPLVCVVIFAIASFALIGIGGPLAGAGTFAGVDTLSYLSPQRDESMAGVSPGTINMGDTVDFALPNATLFGEELRRGEYAQWNPYILGGVPLAATPNFGLLSPVALPFLVLPGWLAPGYMKLLEIIVAAGGCYLFLRRIRLRKPAAWMGGLAFASSGYLIVWTGWPQSRVAVFIPALFWALERVIQRSGRRRAQDVALVGLPVAAMLLSGFPAVTGYAVSTAGCYFLIRVLAERAQWRRVVGPLLTGGAGVLSGLALAAFQLLPWAWFMSQTLIRGRAQGPEHHIPPEMLLTTIAPYLFGTVNPDHPPMWFHARIFIEYSWYVGAATVLLAGISVVAARRARARLPRGVWGFLVAAAGGWGVLIFFGGPLLALAQQLPVLFSDNFVGRARSVLGFLVAVLAAVGYQLVLDRREEHLASGAAASSATASGVSWVWRGLAVLAGAAGFGVLLQLGLRIAYQQNAAKNSDGALPHFAWHMATHLAIGIGFLAATAGCVAWLWWRPSGRRHLAAGLIPVLIAAQALLLAVPYHPRVEREHFFPITNAARYLQQHLGHERFYGATGAIYGGVEAVHRIRALHGHIYLDRRFAELLETMPGQQFDTPPTYLNGNPADGRVATHPVLDRVGVSHYMVSPDRVPYGVERVAQDDGSTVRLTPRRPVEVSLRAAGPLRAVGVTPAASVTPPDVKTRLSAVVRDATGAVIAEAGRIVRAMAPGVPFYLPVAAESAARGDRLTVELSLTGPRSITLQAAHGALALSTVTGVDDGLRLVYDDSSVIYQRSTALPRARWASQAVIEPHRDARLRLLASGKLAADQVVLNLPGPAAEGRPATVRWTHDGGDEMTLSVNAEGAGYLVIADAIRSSWSASVDGAATELVAADHGLAAVPVPVGEHTVKLWYEAPYHNAGGWISGVTALLLLTWAVVEWRWGRVRRIRGRNRG